MEATIEQKVRVASVDSKHQIGKAANLSTKWNKENFNLEIITDNFHNYNVYQIRKMKYKVTSMKNWYTGSKYFALHFLKA